MRDLLNTNAKLSKSVDGSNFFIRGLSFAPANYSGREVCAWRGACAALCVLWFAGRTVTASVRNAATERTKLFFEDRENFLRQLCAEITLASCKALELGAQLLIRLNTASDIVWERVAPQVLEHVASVGGLNYDYTKARPCQRLELPAHYHLTHSVHERTTLDDIREAVALGRNVAPVIGVPYRATGKACYHKFGVLPEHIEFVSGSDSLVLPCVDGDQIDARIPSVDGSGVAVCLRAKSSKAKVAQAIKEGFVFGVDDWQHANEYTPTLKQSHVVKGSVLRCTLAA